MCTYLLLSSPPSCDPPVTALSRPATALRAQFGRQQLAIDAYVMCLEDNDPRREPETHLKRVMAAQMIEFG